MAIDTKIRLEKIIEIAREKSKQIIAEANPESNYELIQKRLNKDFKAIQWYASQRNDLGSNENYIQYSYDMLDVMDDVYDKINVDEVCNQINMKGIFH